MSPKRVDILRLDRLASSADMPLQRLDIVLLVAVVARVVDKVVEATTDVFHVVSSLQHLEPILDVLPRVPQFVREVLREVPSTGKLIENLLVSIVQFVRHVVDYTHRTHLTMRVDSINVISVSDYLS